MEADAVRRQQEEQTMENNLMNPPLIKKKTPLIKTPSPNVNFVLIIKFLIIFYREEKSLILPITSKENTKKKISLISSMLNIKKENKPQLN